MPRLSIRDSAGARDVRRHNLRLVLGLVRSAATIARGDIVARTGMTKTTVTSLVGELTALGLVRDVGRRDSGGRGRPSRLLTLDGRHLVMVVAEVHTDQVTATAYDLAGEVRHTLTRGFDVVPTPRQAVDVVAECGRSVAPVDGIRPTIAGVAVAVPGMLDITEGVVVWAPNLGWRQIQLAELVRAELEDSALLVDIDRFANYALIAEHAAGADLGPDVVLFYGDVGIGLSHLVDGRILRGAKGYAGEVAHLLLDVRGPVCDCGRRGCLAAMVGLGPAVAALGLAGGRISGRHNAAELLDEIVAGAEAGATDVRRELRRQARWLAQGTASVLHLLNPSDLVLAGNLSRLAPLSWETFDEELRTRALPQHLEGCALRVSELGVTAVRRGAREHLVDALLDRALSAG
jgi:predicted NBD/HSP70 family sugar kinase